MSAKPIATAGPFQGMRYNLAQPYVDSEKYLLYGTNGYFPDARGGSSWLGRPGVVLRNGSSQMGTGQRTQGTCAHVDPSSGTIYRFFAVNGVLYRSNDVFDTGTDVSPVGIAISTSSTARVSFLSVGASLVVTDGVNRPWVMSNFAGTPVTGTYIQIDAAGNAWSSWGKPTLYQDSVFFIAQTVPGGSAVQSRVGIVWSEPNQPAVGYTQTGYADYWNIIENGTDPLYAILGTNAGLFYWRANSIGIAAGTPSINFSTTATRDARGDAVGTVSPWAVAIYRDNIFFVDAKGRPWMMPLDGNPRPIWQQLFSLLSSIDVTNLTPANLSYFAVGTIVPELNQYAVAMVQGLTSNPPNSALVFDGETGTFAGFWVFGSAAGVSGVGINVLDLQRDASGASVLCVAGGKTANASGGYVATLSAINTDQWYDNYGTAAITLSATTARLGFTASRNLLPDYVNILLAATGTLASVVVQGSYGSYTVSSIVPTTDGLGGEARAVLGLDGAATRFVSFTVNGPALPNIQWGVQRFEVFGTTATAGADER